MAAENGAPGGPTIDLGPIRDLIRSVRNRVDDVLDMLNSVVDRIASTIKVALDALLPAIGEAIAGAIGVFGTLVDGLLSNLSTVPELAAGVGAEMTARVQGAAAWLGQVTAGGWPAFWDSVTASVVGGVPEQTRARLLRSFDGVTLPGSNITIGAAFASLGDTARVVGLLFGLLQTTPAAWAVHWQPELELTSQRVWSAQPTRVATPEQAIDAAARGVIEWPEAAELARRSGLRPDQINILAAPHVHRVDGPAIVEMWARRLITRDEALTALRRAGTPEWAAWRLLEIRGLPVSPSDLPHLVAREAFEPDQIRDLQLDAELPGYYLETAQRIGVPEEMARWLWYAHWEPMPLTYAYEAFHRGFITQDRLNAILKQHEILPWVREALTSITYNPLTRVDVRRAYDLGVLTVDDVRKRYRDLGYNQDDAEALTQFTARLKESNDETDRLQRTAPIRTRVVEAYRDATIPRQGAYEALLGLGDKPESIDLLLGGADVDRVRRRMDAVRDALRPLFVQGYATEPEVLRELSNAGIDGEEAEQLLASWRINRRYREATDYERSQRDLTKSEVINAYKSRLQSSSDTMDMLRGLGYDDQEANALLSLADYQLEQSTRSQQERTVRALMLAGRIDQRTARDRLLAIPIPLARVDLLLEQWQVERDERTPDIGLSVLEEGIREGQLEEAPVRAELVRRGYTEGETDILLAVWRARTMVAERRIELQERALEQRAALQSQRLEAQERLQNARLAASLERDARRAATQADRDARLAQTELSRLERQIAAADAQLTRRLEQQTAIEARREALEQRRLEAQTAAQQRTIDAQAARLERQIEARREETRVQQEYRDSLLTRQDDLRRAAETRAEERRQAAEQRAELRQISTEERAYARKLATTALALEQERALADARSAALEQIIASIRASLSGALQGLTARLGGIVGGTPS